MSSRRTSNTNTAVEDIWLDILTSQGVDRTDAESITIRLQTGHETALGSPSTAEVEDLIKTNIDHLDLKAYGLTNPEPVKAELKRVLKEGLNGTRPGPASDTPNRGPTVPVSNPDPSDGDTGKHAGQTESEPDADEPTEQFTLDMPNKSVGGSGDGIGAGAHGASGHTGRSDAQQPSQGSQEADTEQDSDPEYEGPYDESPDTAADADASTSQTSDGTPLTENEENLVGEQLAQDSPTDANEPDGRAEIESLRDIALHSAWEDAGQAPSELEADLDDVLPYFLGIASDALQIHEELIKQTMFPAHSPAEREIFYQAFIEDRGLELITGADQ